MHLSVCCYKRSSEALCAQHLFFQINTDNVNVITRCCIEFDHKFKTAVGLVLYAKGSQIFWLLFYFL